MRELLQKARKASWTLPVLTSEQKDLFLVRVAQDILASASLLISANRLDCEEFSEKISKSMMARLKLDTQKISALADSIMALSKLPDPLGQVQLKTELDSGLNLERITVPLGVVAVVFESRPDVLPQIASLCLKSGNAVVLKGGREALRTNRVFVDVFRRVSEMSGLHSHWLQFLETREQFSEVLSYPDLVDLVVPRGSNELVQSIQAQTRIPVLGHADGVCHLFIDASANPKEALRILHDAKTQYPSACNSVETLLVHEQIFADLGQGVVSWAQSVGVELFGCERFHRSFPQVKFCNDWHREYADLQLSVKVVGHVADAVQHINTFGSHHTDAIISQSDENIRFFLDQVDSACVFSNCSTRFADGFRFGFGAEVGISTNRTHARGPVGLQGLLSYKYRLRGTNHVVGDYVGDSPSHAFTHRQLL